MRTTDGFEVRRRRVLAPNDEGAFRVCECGCGRPLNYDRGWAPSGNVAVRVVTPGRIVWWAVDARHAARILDRLRQPLFEARS